MEDIKDEEPPTKTKKSSAYPSTITFKESGTVSSSILKNAPKRKQPLVLVKPKCIATQAKSTEEPTETQTANVPTTEESTATSSAAPKVTTESNAPTTSVGGGLSLLAAYSDSSEDST